MNRTWKTRNACRGAAVALALAAAPDTASAQTVPPPEQTPPAESAPVLEPEPLVEPPPAPPPPPPAPPEPDKPLVRFYGIVKPTIVVANGLESFGNANYVAPTAAVHPFQLPNPDAIGVSFQAQQTRLGLAVGEGLPVKGVVEVDFVDFAKSSPAQSTTIRVRQAFVEWSPADGHKLTLGQLWDMWSPLNSHTYNLVGGLFQSGNSGFMRHQLIYMYTMGDLEFGGALGLTAQNLGAALNQVEYNHMPTIALRASYRMDKTAWVGASLIGTRLRFNPNSAAEETTMALGGNLFAEATLGGLNLRAEAYGGQNLNNLGALVLGQGSAAEDVSEVGAWVSGKYSVDVHAAYLVVGAAFVLNTDDMAIGYTPAMGDTGFARAGGNGPGIERNVTLRVGYAYTPLKGLSIICEPLLMFTRHKLTDADAAIEDEDRIGYGLETGALYQF